jgi:2-hydroxy-6-oxonona-2,4-dienedioate hydrolase
MKRTITLEEIVVGARGARVWLGGDGETLVLLHGAWGGAEMHWGTVWHDLAQRFRVIAPELPGVGDAASGLDSFDDYAAWLAELLGALTVPHAWCIGNSFGAAVAWQLGARLGPRCRGVVLVNGVPPPALPSLVRKLVAIAPLHRLLRAAFRKINFSPAVLGRAFADPSRAPSQLVEVLAHPPSQRLDLLLRVLVSGASAARPEGPVLVAWGAADRLAGTAGPSAARKLQRTIAGAQLALIAAAGHCPQLERPAQFVEAIASFIAAEAPRQEALTTPARRA